MKRRDEERLNKELLALAANTIRFLAVDMIENAASGHPGMPMGLADVMSVFSAHYSHNPKNPKWLNRDRVVFSGGHGSAMIYALLHLWGYDLSLDDLKNFRKFGSKTPGHPESIVTSGVEVTTGPLGQGFANAAGFALAEKRAQHLLGDAIDHKVWCFCGDGDIMEGVSYEAASFAGHYKLNNLIVVYDCNEITIDGRLDICFSENVGARFRAQGWYTIEIDGHDYEAIDGAFMIAKNQSKPTLIIAKTRIARGSAHLEGSHKTHGAPLGKSEVEASKARAGWSEDSFYIPKDAAHYFSEAVKRGAELETAWKADLEKSGHTRFVNTLTNPDFSKIEFPEFDDKPRATRDTNHAIINAIVKALPGFIGGSADLASSNKTELTGMGEAPEGANIRFGVREHAMSAITNAIAAYGLFFPFDSTFFVFSDYQKPAVRAAALMKAKRFFIWTHDSIGVGEDGATHQPIEQLTAFRALPNFYVFRPADGAENIECWKKALSLDAPSGFVLSRQNLPALDRKEARGGAEKGAYLIAPAKNPKATIIASGSEVSIAIAAQEKLAAEGIAASVVSAPCFDLLCQQDDEYLTTIFDPSSVILAIEAASGAEWFRFADAVIAMESFGASAKGDELYKRFGITADRAVEFVKAMLA
ncbi:MAG: transketolase [Helicobacteraceae bacterium]|jgi:transketolase|nr:transketolase [Helicobacteraceae bacterium]